ncbi:MAG: D-glycerate dehydrogenase [Dehalococcoidia bacterium]
MPSPVKPRVFVSRQLPGSGLDRLRAEAEVTVWDDELPPAYERLLEEAGRSEALITLLTDRIDSALMDAAPRLRVISNVAVGYDNIDVAAATQRGILVTNTPGVLTETTADFAFALLMAAARRVVEGDRATREGRWRTWHPSFLLGQDIHGATLGIVGLGAIGLALARRARAFGMRMLYHDSVRRPEAESDLNLAFAPLDELLREADFVSVHVPLSDETHHLFGRRAFGLMKRTAAFINTSRGPVVDEAALHHALRSGEIAAAAIDVTEVEPLPADSLLLDLPNLIVTPHIASASLATRARMADMAIDNALAVLRGGLPEHCVNPQAAARRP